MNNEFIWTDELVKEFNKEWLPKFDTNEYTINVGMERFKESKKPKKEYEILAKRFRNTEGPLDTLVDEIVSVKRLSDGEVFSVGDMVYVQGDKNKKHEIYSFQQGDNTIVALSNTFDVGMNYIKYLQKANQPIKLFTADDGVDIFEGYYIWNICLTDWSLRKHVNRAKKDLLPIFSTHFKYFSTKEKAEEYILMNKPILTLNEVMNTVYVGVSYGEIIRKLKELAKQKINTK